MVVNEDRFYFDGAEETLVRDGAVVDHEGDLRVFASNIAAAQ